MLRLMGLERISNYRNLRIHQLCQAMPPIGDIGSVPGGARKLANGLNTNLANGPSSRGDTAMS